VATFIPEWSGTISAAERKLKEIFAGLDAAFVVRRPLAKTETRIFLQHPTGWAAIALTDAAFATVAPGQLFAHDNVAKFRAQLAALDRLGGISEATNRALAKVVFLWGCTRDEAAGLARAYGKDFQGHFLARDEVLGFSNEVVAGLLAPLAPAQEAELMTRFFPEAEIPPAYATRRIFHRDNSAKLTQLFFDPDQEWASKLDVEPPAEHARLPGDFSVRLINGVAGSGKTLIVLKRAMLLAQRDPAARILVISHNTPIVADLTARLQRAHGEIPGNLDIRTFYSLAVEQWSRLHSKSVNPIPKARVLTLLDDLTHDSSEPHLDREDLADELEFIDDTWLTNEGQYLEANRAGRGFALRPRERQQIWALRTALLGELAAQGLQLWSSLPRQICEHPERDRVEKYGHILVDEAQFFAPAWFEVVKGSLAPGGHLFLCADPNQGFLKRRLSWKRAGLDVTGRTKKLRTAYRTTRALLQAADHVLATSAAEDPEEFLKPDFSRMEAGAPPFLLQVSSSQDAVDRVANEITAAIAERGLRLRDVLIIYGGNVSKGLLYEHLCRRFGTTRIWWLNKDDQKRRPPAGPDIDHLRMAYLDSATGLEANLVFVLGAERLLADTSEAGTRKLYMAMTRAAQRLVFVVTERPPSHVAEVFQAVR
jgi:AAA domain